MAGLTLEICVRAVVQSTPHPNSYQAGNAANTFLEALGVVDAIAQGHFLARLKDNIKPYALDTTLVTSSPGTSVQIAASSVLINARAQ